MTSRAQLANMINSMHSLLARSQRPMLLFAAITFFAACTTELPRTPVPERELGKAAPYGIQTKNVLRMWGDSLTEEMSDTILGRWTQIVQQGRANEIRAGGPLVEFTLALSGGGPDGAFSAGLLNGWSARGDRPNFNLVTGISTGAIVAIYAFLGPDYDDVLKEIYTNHTTDQLFARSFLSALTGGAALTDARGYRQLIEKYIDDDVVKKLAEKHKEGRALLIGTTNLDAARPVIWSLGSIAASGHPDAKALIWDVIQASSAIPAVFPPVIIPVVTEDGQRFDEMHVDGGATQQVMYFSPSLPMRTVDDALGVEFKRTVYVVMNNKLDKSYSPVRPRILAIAGAAASSLLSGSGTGDIYKIFSIAKRDGIDMRVASIPTDFQAEANEAFDPVYMKVLYELGYSYGLSGDRWLPNPPDYVEY